MLFASLYSLSLFFKTINKQICGRGNSLQQTPDKIFLSAKVKITEINICKRSLVNLTCHTTACCNKSMFQEREFSVHILSCFSPALAEIRQDSVSLLRKVRCGISSWVTALSHSIKAVVTCVGLAIYKCPDAFREGVKRHPCCLLYRLMLVLLPSVVPVYGRI